MGDAVLIFAAGAAVSPSPFCDELWGEGLHELDTKPPLANGLPVQGRTHSAASFGLEALGGTYRLPGLDGRDLMEAS